MNSKKIICMLGITLCFGFLAPARTHKNNTHQVAIEPKKAQKIAPLTPPKTIQPSVRTITIKNDIEKKMTGYKYIFKTYYPSEFTLMVNGKEIEQGGNLKLSIKNNKLFIRYFYSFRPYKTGTKEVEFDVEPTAQDIAITFSWKDDWRIIAAHANPVAIKEITA